MKMTQGQKAKSANKKTARKEIKARPATLQSLGFESGEHVLKANEPALNFDNFEDYTNKLVREDIERRAKPVTLSPRISFLVRAFCDAANVDADEWAEGWIAALVDQSLKDGPDHVGFSGICEDLLGSHGPNGKKRSAKAEDELVERFANIIRADALKASSQKGEQAK